jgi:hypothetical protein
MAAQMADDVVLQDLTPAPWPSHFSIAEAIKHQASKPLVSRVFMKP